MKIQKYTFFNNNNFITSYANKIIQYKNYKNIFSKNQEKKKEKLSTNIVILLKNQKFFF